MFKYKTEDELGKMTPDQRDIYSEQKRAFEAEATQKMISDAIAKSFPAKTPEEVKAEADTAKAASDAFDALKEDVQIIKESTSVGGAGFDAVSKEINKHLADNFEKIKAIHKAGSGVIEFEVKAVADITTGNGTNTAPPAITGTQMAPLQNVNLRQMSILGLTTSFNTNQAAYAYTEAKPKDGDYAFVAEGAAKPQIDFNWETNYAKPVKAAAWLRLTEESVQDVKGLESVARNFLFKKHNIRKAKGILFGDGISPNPKGATVYGRVFSAGPLALAVDSPNFMDVINAAITDIATTHNYEDETPYYANLVLINPVDFFLQLVSAKDTQGHPLYPMASLFNMVIIGGVTIMPEELIPQGKIFVADMEKYNTTNYMSYVVKIGWINDDFIKNQFVMLGESRFHAFVKKLDEQAFLYDDIATIKTAITKP